MFWCYHSEELKWESSPCYSPHTCAGLTINSLGPTVQRVATRPVLIFSIAVRLSFVVSISTAGIRHLRYWMLLGSDAVPHLSDDFARRISLRMFVGIVAKVVENIGLIDFHNLSSVQVGDLFGGVVENSFYCVSIPGRYLDPHPLVP